ncbi:MAG: dcm [Neobacillus sp.]|nr:dcm [Neobacillus sp.]
MNINVLSLFDGISCGRESLKQLDKHIDNYFASEIEESAIEVALKNHPNITPIGDINNLTGDKLKKLPKIDLILAGSPCQGFSRNGKGLNFDDPRSKLFFKFIDIVNWIKENNNPDVKFLLENVVMKKEWEKVIDQYTSEKSMEINSSLVSAQKRPRLYWTNIEGVQQPKDKSIELKDILETNVPNTYDVEEEILKSDPVELYDWRIERFIEVKGDIAIVRQATKQGYLIAEDGDSINLTIPNSKTRRGRVGKGKANTLDTQCNQAVFIDGRIRRFTITELERLQGLPDGYTDGIKDAARKKAIGNGWNIDTIVHILSYLK